MPSIQIPAIDETSHKDTGQAPSKTHPICGHQPIGLTQFPTQPAEKSYGHYQAYFSHTISSLPVIKNSPIRFFR
jgi:hypothetical protein